jgi:hypothetical protein
LEAADVTALEAAIEKAKASLKEHAENADELQKATDELMQASYKIAEILYKNKDEQNPADTDKQEDGQKQEAHSNKDTIDADIS